MTIISKYDVSGTVGTRDGRNAWFDLVDLYTKSYNASEFRIRLHRRLINLEADPMGSRVFAMNLFLRIVREHNHYCEDPSQLIDGMTKLTHFEKYITAFPEMKALKTTLDENDDPHMRGFANLPRRTPAQRMQSYETKAVNYDRDHAAELRSHTQQSRRSGSRRQANVTDITTADVFGEEFGDMQIGSEDLQSEFGSVYAHQADIDTTSTLFLVNTAEFDALMERTETYYVNLAGGVKRRPGYLPKDVYNTLDPEHKKAWMAIPAASREKIMNCLGNSTATALAKSSSHAPVRPGSALRSDALKRGIAGNRNVRVNAAVAIADLESVPLVPVNQDDSEIIAKVAVLEDIASSENPVLLDSVDTSTPIAQDTDDEIRANSMIIHALTSKSRLTDIPPEAQAHLNAREKRNNFHHDVFLSKANVSKKTRQRIPRPSNAKTKRTAQAAETSQGDLFPDLLGDSDGDGIVRERLVNLATVMSLSPSEEEDNGLSVDKLTVIISAANVYDIVGLIDGGANGGLATKDEMR